MIAAQFGAGFKSSRVSLALAAVAVIGALATGCGDSSTTDAGIPPSIELPRPAELLTTYMKEAFQSRDSTLVAELLHDEFSCMVLREDADSLRDGLGDDFCGKALYLSAVGRLFRDPTVTGITLDIVINSNVRSADEGCLDCRRLDATWTIRIATEDDGGEPVAFVVDAPITFYVALDPQRYDWVLWKQISRSSPSAKPQLAGWFDCCAIGGPKP